MAILLVLCVGAVSAADVNADNVLGDVPNTLSEDNSTNITVDVPSSVDVDIKSKNVSFNINVTEDGEPVDVTEDDLILNLTYNTDKVVSIEDFNVTDNYVEFIIPVDFTSLSSLDVYYENVKSTISLNPVGIIVDVPSIVDVDVDDKDVSFEIIIRDGNSTVTPSRENLILNLTVNGTYVPLEAYNETLTFDNSVIKFKIPSNFTSASLDVTYKDVISTVVLNPIVSNKMDIANYVVIDTDKNVEFVINLTDKNNNTLEFTEDDLEIIVKYLGDDSKNFTYIVEDFTVNDTKVTFTLPSEEGNFNKALMSIYYKNDTVDKATLDKTINFCVIKVLTEECLTQYQNNLIVAQLWNNYLNSPVASSTLYYQFKNASQQIRWGVSTDDNGKCNKTLDSLNYDSSFQLTYVSVGNNYAVVISSQDDIAVAQQCTLNISKATGKLSANNYSSTYASGKKFTVKFTNSEYATPINAVIKLTIYQGTYNSKTKKYVYYTKNKIGDFYAYTNSSGISSIGVNLGAGKFKVVTSNYDTGNITAKSITNYLTIKKVSAKIYASKTTVYYNNGNTFKVKMTTTSGTPLKGAAVLLNVYTGSKYKAVQLTTGDNGWASWTVTGIGIGTHKVLIGSGSTGASASVVQTSIIVKKGKTVVTAPKVNTTVGTSNTFKITVKTYNTNKTISKLPLTVKLYKSGKLYKTISLKTNTKGYASFNTKTLPAGTYTVKITSTSSYYTVSKTSYIYVVKVKTVVTAPKVTTVKGTSNTFNITVKNYNTNKTISSLPLTVKLYKNNKLYKTISLKTNANGFASFNTKTLALGNYTVKITSTSSKYAVSKTSYIDVVLALAEAVDPVLYVIV